MQDKYRYVTCDVFTHARFGGNPLAVLPEAGGLTDLQMQRIAREFNYSETTFVFPPEGPHTRKVRIFTPVQELPFAGHPNIGTAFVLAASGALGEIRSSLSVIFEEKAGLVPITIREVDGKIASCELKAPQPLSFAETVPKRLVASAVSLEAADIVTETHEPQVASMGFPFLFAQLRDRASLARVRSNITGFEAIRDVLEEDHQPVLYLYTLATEDVDVQARMLAPLSGVPEDPATGGAGCALVGLLAHHNAQASGDFSYRIAQGVEMGRSSLLLGRARKSDGQVESAWIAGSCVPVTEGTIQVE